MKNLICVAKSSCRCRLTIFCSFCLTRRKARRKTAINHWTIQRWRMRVWLRRHVLNYHSGVRIKLNYVAVSTLSLDVLKCIILNFCVCLFKHVLSMYFLFHVCFLSHSLILKVITSGWFLTVNVPVHFTSLELAFFLWFVFVEHLYV